MKKITTIMALFVIGLIAISGVVSAKGFFGDNEDMKTALENNDYESWQELMQNRINEDTFNKEIERHQEMQERHQLREDVKEAIESGDYDAWKEATENLEKMHPKESITEENFPLLVEMHQAKQDGDIDRAREIQNELGLHTPQRPGWKVW